jgi:hypothetical protein
MTGTRDWERFDSGWRSTRLLTDTVPGSRRSLPKKETKQGSLPITADQQR